MRMFIGTCEAQFSVIPWLIINYNKEVDLVKILFVCTGNTCRSSMAEGILKEMLKEKDDKYEDIQVLSAGISAIDGDPPSEFALKALEEQGIDISQHCAKQLSSKMVKEADLILTMTVAHKNMILSIISEAKEKTYTLKEYAVSDLKLQDILEELDILHNSTNRKKESIQRGIEELEAKRQKLLSQLEELDKELEKLRKKSQVDIKDEKEKTKNLERKIQYLDISDPYGMPYNRYKDCAKEITDSIEKVINKIN